MPTLLARLAARQHLALALLSAWLILASPWVHMFRRIPRNAGFMEYSHIVLGLVALVLAVTFTFRCTRRGRWRLYFPWLAGNLGQAWGELRALVTRREVPSAEGGGLFAIIEGLLLLALLAAALTGAAWLLVLGSAEAVTWRHYHILAARGMIALLVLHMVTVSLHLVDFIRE